MKTAIVLFIILAIVLVYLANHGSESETVGKEVRGFWQKVATGVKNLLKGWHEKPPSDSPPKQ